jgi:type IV pilus assembly protein PilC
MKFSYKAYKDQKVVSGKIEGESHDKVIEYLKAKNYIIIDVAKDAGSINQVGQLFDRIAFNDIVELTRQLAIMLNAGLTIIDSFEIIKKQTVKPAMLKIIIDITSEIKAGNSFSFALKKYPNHFSNLYISLVRSGEASGKLDDILQKLADNLEKQREFQSKVKGALN